jgi:replication factor C large subunit
MEQWIEKYSPKKISEVAGNENAKDEIISWVRECEKGKTKPLMLFGTTGSGKTAMAKAIAIEKNWNLIEFSSFDLYDEEKFKSALSSVSQRGLFGKSITLIDDVSEETEAKIITRIGEIVRKASEPLILILDNPWTQKFVGLRLGCKMVEFKKINSADIKKVLKRISESEKIELKIENFTGDIRSHINDLQAGSTENRDRNLIIFEAVRKTFNSSLSNALKAVDESGLDLDFFIKWIEENIPAEYEDKSEIAEAYDWLSKGDVYNGKKAMGLTLYYKVVSVGGVNISKKREYHKFIKYSFPEVIRKLSESKKRREVIKKISEEVAVKLHCSSKYARRNVIPYLQDIPYFKSNFNIQSLESL